MTKILCIHGVGHAEKDENFQASWVQYITEAVHQVSPGADIQFDFFLYDSLFEEAGPDGGDYAEAVARLLYSGFIHTIGDWFSRGRGLADIPDQVEWTAGMVAQWVADEGLRKKLRGNLQKKVGDFQPDIICAHSLGSLIAYDTLSLAPGLKHETNLVTFGSQISNPAVREVFGGRIRMLDNVASWFHLYNSEDRVFAAPLRVVADNFHQVRTYFDKPDDILNHDAGWYIDHSATRASVWTPLFPNTVTPLLKQHSKEVSRVLRPQANIQKPTSKALLIGINAYPNPADRLEGCVNDVFLMSSVLQESGFAPDDIRVVLDERASTEGIRERLTWLLADTCPGDRRVLFYSGHGAQIPALNIRGEADRLDECLCPWDFDWTQEKAITDKFFRDLYAQLPYDSHFVAIFDCCHSGGMTRDGARRARGLTPPDDIRHRMLRWDPDRQMWVERDWVKEMRRQSAAAEDGQTAGNRTSIRRLGQAIALRGTNDQVYDQRRKQYKHHGPYLPVLMHACREEQLSYEYRHGVTSYGAFTYSLAHILRTSRHAGRNLTFEELMAETAARLLDLGYEQEPVLVGPRVVLGGEIPWSGKNEGKNSSPTGEGREKKPSSGKGKRGTTSRRNSKK